MFFEVLRFFVGKFLLLTLHLDSGSFPRPLTAQEEISAFAEMKKGSLSARDRLIRHNLRLVAHIAKKYYAAQGDQEDMISIGTIGLIKAVNTFDNERQARFSTYASKCIENEIRMQLRHGRHMAGTVSLQETLETGHDGTALTVMDTIPDDNCMEDNLEHGDECKRLRAFVEQLNGKERQVILLRYGMAGQPPLTQQQTAEILDISRSYVSRIETRALTELRKMKLKHDK